MEMTMDTTTTKLTALNCHGFKTNSDYINLLTTSYDIIYLSELWITESEKHLLNSFNIDFNVYFQPAAQGESGRPFGGTALLIRKSLPKPELIMKNDFTTIIKIQLRNYALLLIGVYLQSTSKTSNFKDIYASQLASVGGIIKQFSNSTEPIILGDFQSCPSTHQTERTRNKNALTENLNSFILDQQLTPIDITHGTGPDFTYHHVSLDNKSYIDHILTSHNILSKIVGTGITPPHYLNTSDHLPVTAEMTMETSNTNTYKAKQSNHIPNFMWKNKNFLNNYNSLVTNKIETIKCQDIIEEEISTLHQTLKDCASQAYLDLKKESDFHFVNTKRWWSADLTNKRKILQKMFNSWREDNFSRDPHNVHYNRYLLARKEFRNLAKKSKNQSTAEHYVNIDKIKKIKPRSYWNQIRSAKSEESKLYTINNSSDIPDITKGFNSHFENLLNTPRTDNIDNNTSNQHLDKMLGELEEHRENDFHITDSDILSAINSLNKNKTFDPYEIKAEHFIHCTNEKVLSYIANLVNRILNAPRLPTILSTSHIVPILKSHRKPINDPNNYRGVSLIPILTKLIEKLIILKCPQLKEHKDTQFGFTSDASTIHAELLIRDTISFYNSKGSPVYICSLDAEKAFDSCNWYVLFEKLKNQRKLPDVVLRFLIKLYINGEAATKYRNFITSPFRLAQGVRQGSILSPYLYNFYTEDIIDNIQRLNIGTYLPGQINTSIIVFADDIILLSPNLKHLQQMINECTLFGIENGLKFNPSKTQFLISGQSPLCNPCITLNEKQIEQQCQLKHLGFNWKMDRDKLSLKNHQDSRIAEMWATTASLTSCGVRK
eukprot:TCONS_00057647-protein